MPRQPDTAIARKQWISIRVTPREVDEIDRLRGLATRSAYVRELLASALANERVLHD